jgi:hypothetical protein
MSEQLKFMNVLPKHRPIIHAGLIAFYQKIIMNDVDWYNVSHASASVITRLHGYQQVLVTWASHSGNALNYTQLLNVFIHHAVILE